MNTLSHFLFTQSHTRTHGFFLNNSSIHWEIQYIVVVDCTTKNFLFLSHCLSVILSVSLLLSFYLYSRIACCDGSTVTAYIIIAIQFTMCSPVHSQWRRVGRTLFSEFVSPQVPAFPTTPSWHPLLQSKRRRLTNEWTLALTALPSPPTTTRALHIPVWTFFRHSAAWLSLFLHNCHSPSVCQHPGYGKANTVNAEVCFQIIFKRSNSCLVVTVSWFSPHGMQMAQYHRPSILA